MKFLVVTQFNTGTKNAVIFESLTDAKAHLKEIESNVKYPMTARWSDDDETLLVELTPADKIRLFISRVDRAEYRLARHARGERDEERRFSVRQNAVNFVKDKIRATDAENNLGDWTGHDDCSYKLYTVVLCPEEGSQEVLRRFGAALTQSLIFEDIERYASDDTKKVVIEKRHQTTSEKIKSAVENATTKVRSTKKRKRIFAVAALAILAVVGVKLATTDWQMIADERKASQFSASADVKNIADSLYLTRKGRAVFFASQPKLLGSTAFNKTCGRDGSGSYISGCYYQDDDDGDEHIEIFDVGTSTINENGVTFNFAEYRKSVALHEMLHAAWERFDDGKKNSTCKDLRMLSNQITTLKKELSIYDSDSVCTELFARVGAEYIAILSPVNSVSSSGADASYSSLNAGGKEAVSNLVKIYNDYFDTTKTSLTINYWKNANQLDSFETKVLTYYYALESKKNSTQSLINQYYAWPTWSRYYAANNAIDEYNSMVSTYNSYYSTYNKIYSKLDSEHKLNSGSYLGL